jgi:hypothetical protein
MQSGITKLQVAVLALAALPALASEPAEDPQKPQPPEDQIVVMKVSGEVVTPEEVSKAFSRPTSAELLEIGLIRPLQPALDMEICHLGEVTVDILDPATARAVIRESSEPPRVVRPGSVLVGTTAIVREIGFDKLVVDVENDDANAVLWIQPAERLGAPARMQCFVPVTSPQPAPGAGTAEPPRHQ